MTENKFFEELAKLKGQFRLFGPLIRRHTLVAGPPGAQRMLQQCPVCAVAEESGHDQFCGDYYHSAYDLDLPVDIARTVAKAADGRSGRVRERLLKTLDLQEVV